MQAFLTLVRRELGAYFNSYTGYVVLAVVLLLIGLTFAGMIQGMNGQPTPVPITQLYFQNLFFWMILVLAAPVITMRSFALEKDSGTFETLMTAPVSDRQVVAAKFTGALIFYAITWLPLLADVMVLRYFGGAQAAFDFGLLASTALGILLIGCLYMSVGVFASSLTRSQVTAAMISFAAGLTLFMLSFAGASLPADAGVVAEVLAAMNLLHHMEGFAAGIIDTRAVVLLLSLTALFLFLTLRVVESRRWK
jgi:ABC-2 type transport system permease protein